MAFQLPKPVNFAAVLSRKAEDGVPTPTRSKAARRRVACVREAAAVLDALPEPGEALHALMTGRYDLTDLLAVLIERFGPAALKIATLSFNFGNTVDVLSWIDAKKVTALDLLCSSFFREHNAELFRGFKADLHQRGGRLAACRNHAKVVTLAFASGERFALEGSANLQNQRERRTVCPDPRRRLARLAFRLDYRPGESA